MLDNDSFLIGTIILAIVIFVCVGFVSNYKTKQLELQQPKYYINFEGEAYELKKIN